MTSSTSLPSHWHAPGTAQYASELAGFQTAYAHRPDLVVAARHGEDARAAVEYAARRRLPAGVQATGHGLSVPADRGLVITTGRLDDIRIDPARQIARIGAGVRAGALVKAAAEHGLAPLNGSSPSVGMTGYLLGGGTGLLVRQFGYAADHVTSLDLVTADGRMRTLTPADELLAAVLGTGGSLGVVTALEVGLVPVSRIYGGQLVFDTPLLPAAVQAWRAWTETVPDTVTSGITLVRLPDLPVLPPHLRGRFVASVRVATTDTQHGDKLAAPLRAIGPALSDDLRILPYTESFSVHRDPEDPHGYAATNALVSGLPEQAVDRLLGALGDEPATVTAIRHLGGAASRPSGASVIGHRAANYAVCLIAEARGTAEPAAFAGLLAALAPWTIGRHLNFCYGAADAAGPEQTRAGYSPAVYAELAALKNTYDPANMFRFTRPALSA